MSEFRVALRRLIRSPLYSVLSILLLALGIGATSGLFSAVDAVLLRALPYPQPERLTMLWVDASAQGFSDTDVTNPADLADWRKQLRSFDEVAAFTVWQADLTGLGEPQQLPAAQVTQGYFGVLGVPLALGRDFTAEEDLPDGPRAVILSHAFWRERYGADPQALGQAITLNGEPHTIVGIAAPGLVSPSLSPRSLWRPLQGDTEQRGNYFLTAIGRLADGVSLNAARSEFDALQQRLGAPAMAYRWGRSEGENPYRGLLALADAFVVTGESMSMLAEAAATGRPLFIFDMGDGDTPWWRLRHGWRYKPLSHRLAMRCGSLRMRRDVGNIQQALVASGRASWLDESSVAKAADRLRRQSAAIADSAALAASNEELRHSAAAVRRLLTAR